MVRATFFALGLFVTVWGVSLLAIDEVVLTREQSAREQPGFRGMLAFPGQQTQQRIEPPQWAPFTFISLGSVTMLYSFMLMRNKE
jgi:hypothetical protein